MGNDILSKIVTWAEQEEPVRALVLEGSQAENGGADELSDYDVNVFITDPESYARDDRWISAIDNVWVHIPEKITHHGQVFATRLVIYQAGVKVDFILYSTEVLREFAHSDPLPEQYDIGYRVLLDKDGVTAGMTSPSFMGFRKGKPTETAFLECVHEFWFEAYNIAKYLRRRDLWPVKFRDWTTKYLLLRMIEWNERGKHGWDYRTHPLGKHMESWVAPETWEKLSGVFAHFDAEDSLQALFATLELFGRVGRETAQSLGCTYPSEIEENVVAFARELNEPGGCYSAAREGLSMQAATFWRTVTMDHADLLERALQILEEAGARYCVIGGQAVNAYAEPVVSLDLDLALAPGEIERLGALFEPPIRMERFEHSVNLSAPGSDLRIQLQVDPRYQEFPARAEVREVLGHRLPVARLEDVLRGKVWAASDPSRRASKRQKDLADIARLLEEHPELRELVPQSILQRLIE